MLVKKKKNLCNYGCSCLCTLKSWLGTINVYIFVLVLHQLWREMQLLLQKKVYFPHFDQQTMVIQSYLVRKATDPSIYLVSFGCKLAQPFQQVILVKAGNFWLSLSSCDFDLQGRSPKTIQGWTHIILGQVYKFLLLIVTEKSTELKFATVYIYGLFCIYLLQVRSNTAWRRCLLWWRTQAWHTPPRKGGWGRSAWGAWMAPPNAWRCREVGGDFVLGWRQKESQGKLLEVSTRYCHKIHAWYRNGEGCVLTT